MARSSNDRIPFTLRKEMYGNRRAKLLRAAFEFIWLVRLIIVDISIYEKLRNEIVVENISSIQKFRNFNFLAHLLPNLRF